jgi:hypothetical protein
MAAAYTVKGDSFVAGKPRLWSEKPRVILSIRQEQVECLS